MSAEKTQALVIRLADFSESSRVVTLFTRDFGKVAAIAKGAKRLKGPFESALDLLTVCEVVFLRKSSASLDILTEAQLQKRFKPRSGTLPSLYGGYYVAELLDALSEEYDAHPVLYHEALATLERLAGETPLDLTVLRFELVLLREIGQLPVFDACVVCESPLDHAQRYGFSPGQGGLVCPACQGDKTPRQQITSDVANFLSVLSSESAEWPTAAPTPRQVQVLRTITNATIAHNLGRHPRMLRYLPH